MNNGAKKLCVILSLSETHFVSSAIGTGLLKELNKIIKFLAHVFYVVRTQIVPSSYYYLLCP